MQSDILRRAATPLVALIALSALAAPGAASPSSASYQESHSYYAWVCVDVGLSLVTSEASALGPDATLDDLAAVLLSGGVLLDGGVTADAETVERTVAVLRDLFPEGATLTTADGEADRDALDTLLEAAACQPAQGVIRESAQHAHVGTTEVTSYSSEGDWRSTTTTGAWAAPSGIDAGVLTLGTLPFVSANAGGSVSDAYLGIPADCGPALLSTTTAGDDAAPVLWPWVFMHQYIHDATIPTVPLSLDADFCGFGVRIGTSPLALEADARDNA